MIDYTSPDGSYADKFRDAPTIDARKPNATSSAARTLAKAGHDKHRAAYRARAIKEAQRIGRGDLVERLQRIGAA